MAAVTGIDWPVNSVGVLPDVDITRPGYLHLQNGEEAIAHAALVNAKVCHLGLNVGLAIYTCKGYSGTLPSQAWYGPSRMNGHGNR